MTDREQEDLRVCVDCAMLHANGDLSGIEHEDRKEEVLAGLMAYPMLAIGDHIGFSWSRCESCGNGLGGDRFRASVIAARVAGAANAD